MLQQYGNADARRLGSRQKPEKPVSKSIEGAACRTARKQCLCVCETRHATSMDIPGGDQNQSFDIVIDREIDAVLAPCDRLVPWRIDPGPGAENRGHPSSPRKDTWHLSGT